MVYHNSLVIKKPLASLEKLWKQGLGAKEICKQFVSSIASDSRSDNVTCILVLLKAIPN
jgi:hypothetical protein